MKKTFKIFFAAQDPGGFNAILPVIKELKNNKKFPLKIFLANQSRDIAKKGGIDYQDSNNLSDKKLVQLFQEGRPNLVFTATSTGTSIEKSLIKIAKKRKIPTASLIDFWSNYKIRFSDPGTENLIYIPDYILVIDEMMKKEMINQGFDPEKLIITGSPFFDTFPSLIKTGQRGKVISFFCQPLSELFNRTAKDYLGYNEIQVFRDLVESLEKKKVKLPIIIKFHPRAKKLKKFDKIIKNSKMNILIEKKLPVEALIEKSKLVMGMNSVVLFQAAMTGKLVLSYQPNLKKQDPLMSNRLKISTAVYEKKSLYPALKKLLSGKNKKKNLILIKKYTKNKSTNKVIDFIENIIKK